jgi:hypothetical protein
LPGRGSSADGGLSNAVLEKVALNFRAAQILGKEIGASFG